MGEKTRWKPGFSGWKSQISDLYPEKNPDFLKLNLKFRIYTRKKTRPGPAGPGVIFQNQSVTRNYTRKKTGFNPAGPGAHPGWYSFSQYFKLKLTRVTKAGTFFLLYL